MPLNKKKIIVKLIDIFFIFFGMCIGTVFTLNRSTIVNSKELDNLKKECVQRGYADYVDNKFKLKYDCNQEDK